MLKKTLLSKYKLLGASITKLKFNKSLVVIGKRISIVNDDSNTEQLIAKNSTLVSLQTEEYPNIELCTFSDKEHDLVASMWVYNPESDILLNIGKDGIFMNHKGWVLVRSENGDTLYSTLDSKYALRGEILDVGCVVGGIVVWQDSDNKDRSDEITDKAISEQQYILLRDAPAKYGTRREETCTIHILEKPSLRVVHSFKNVLLGNCEQMAQIIEAVRICVGKHMFVPSYAETEDMLQYRISKCVENGGRYTYKNGILWSELEESNTVMAITEVHEGKEISCGVIPYTIAHADTEIQEVIGYSKYTIIYNKSDGMFQLVDLKIAHRIQTEYVYAKAINQDWLLIVEDGSMSNNSDYRYALAVVNVRDVDGAIMYTPYLEENTTKGVRLRRPTDESDVDKLIEQFQEKMAKGDYTFTGLAGTGAEMKIKLNRRDVEYIGEARYVKI